MNIPVTKQHLVPQNKSLGNLTSSVLYIILQTVCVTGVSS